LGKQRKQSASAGQAERVFVFGAGTYWFYAKFAVREKAQAELRKLADINAERLRARLSKLQSAEARVRLTRVLEQYDSPSLPPARLREIRTLELLEYIGSPGAREVLALLANGNPAARRTREAAESLRRLMNRF
jgi:hypothetical protein